METFIAIVRRRTWRFVPNEFEACSTIILVIYFKYTSLTLSLLINNLIVKSHHKLVISHITKKSKVNLITKCHNTSASN